MVCTSAFGLESAYRLQPIARPYPIEPGLVKILSSWNTHKDIYLTRGLGIIRVEQVSTDPNNLTSQA